MKSLKTLSLLSAIMVSSILPIAALAYDNIYPGSAYDMAVHNPNAYILDVRTEAEWQWVGHPGPNLLGEGTKLLNKVVNISYEIEKDGVLIVNEDFIKDVINAFGNKHNAVLITICRSGARSAKAAALLEAAGYRGRVYNTLTGFEGAADSRGYRIVGGWVFDGLPYSYVGLGYKGGK
jgi:rhodanese-related sulfurtransferase